MAADTAPATALCTGHSAKRWRAATLETYQKLAGMLIQMVLKTDPANVRLENGQIVLK